MAIPPRLPTVVQVLEIAKSFGMTLTEEDAASFRGLMAGSIASYARLDELVEPKLPVKYPRDPGYRPPAEENPYNAWYWKTNIVGAKSGMLAGERVAVKDNICVAGVPMMNGSRVLEGYVPEVDATVVTRMLDAGGDDRRQGGLRGSVLFGRQPHLRDRTDPQPAQPEALDRRLLRRQRGAGGRRRSDDGARRRPRRFDPHAIGVVRRLSASSRPGDWCR